MCRTAIIDMRLEGSVDISVCDPPSVALSSLKAKTLVVVNHGKTMDSGLAFGNIVAGRLKRPLLQVERASAVDGMVIAWGAFDEELEVAEKLAVRFQLHLKRMIPTPNVAREDKGCTCRFIKCAHPGEPLFVNGVFVGKVVSPEVRVYARDGEVYRVEGVDTKDTGLSRLGACDVRKALIKSGSLRERSPDVSLCPVREGTGRIAVIDHVAFSSLDSIGPDTVCALTVGDDTTEVAGDVLARLGIRIIGIIDGDRDGVLSGAMRACGSVIFKVRGATDDEAGSALAKTINGADTFDGFVGRVKGELGRMHVSYEVCR